MKTPGSFLPVLHTLMMLALLLAACGPAPTPIVITVIVPATSVPVTGSSTETAAAVASANAEATATVPVEPAATAAPTDTPVPEPSATPQPSATVGPQCTIRQNVNLRYGPGRAYDPPLDALVADTVVIPQAYQALGFPGGPWVQVVNPGNNKTGWVSAAPEFIACTIDLNALPTASIPPTPTPSAPRVSNSQPEGTFDGFEFNLHFSGTYLMRLEVYREGGSQDGDGIQQVNFTIYDSNGNVVRQQTENAAPYCIFGGDSGCAGWPKNEGQYAWTNDGPRVEDGATYQVNIDAESTDGAFANWNFDLQVDVP